MSGTPGDVKRVLPLLHELSAGARRGTPRWFNAPLDGTGPRDQTASWLEITYPFSTDAELRKLYMLGDGESLRAGRFLEELDAFSADVAYRHAGGHTQPIAVVTAAHDGLSIFGTLSAVHDLRLRGAVCAVGSSSMEVRSDLYHVLADDRELYLGSCFTVMVARCAASFSAVQVAALAGDHVDTHAAMQRKARRRALAANALQVAPPSATEVPLLHELWRGGRAGESSPAAQAPMASTEQRAIFIMQPDQRNQNGYIFGGYLLRRALEIAWLSAYTHCRRPCHFGGLDDVAFSKPVVVGKLVEFVGRVVYVAADGSLRVFVEADHISLRTGRREATCNFHFVFHHAPIAKEAKPSRGATDAPHAEVNSDEPRSVQPVTYEETLHYLEGRRRWLEATKQVDSE